MTGREENREKKGENETEVVLLGENIGGTACQAQYDN